MQTTTDFFEVLSTTRSMRRLRPDPVPRELLVRLIDAGVHGPSAANAQNWHFVIVQDRKVMRRMAEPWRKGISLFLDSAALAPSRSGETLQSRTRALAAVTYLADHFEDTPALVCVCIERDRVAEAVARKPSLVASAFRHLGLLGTLRLGMRARRRREQELWATGYTAAENVLLAARALGLGAVMAMPMVLAPPQTYEKILGLPRDVLLAAIIPVGYPLGNFGPVTRPRAEAMVSWDRYHGKHRSTGT